jgi:hypothetical protein
MRFAEVAKQFGDAALVGSIADGRHRASRQFAAMTALPRSVISAASELGRRAISAHRCRPWRSEDAKGLSASK